MIPREKKSQNTTHSRRAESYSVGTGKKSQSIALTSCIAEKGSTLKRKRKVLGKGGKGEMRREGKNNMIHVMGGGGL